jgi:hypothetical protein
LVLQKTQIDQIKVDQQELGLTIGDANLKTLGDLRKSMENNPREGSIELANKLRLQLISVFNETADMIQVSPEILLEWIWTHWLKDAMYIFLVFCATKSFLTPLRGYP